MASTQAAIRDRVKVLIEALTPSALAGDKFKSSRNEGPAAFMDAMEATPILRRFQARFDGSEDPPEVSNTDTDLRHATLVLLIAYPHTARYGADQAMDRDDVIDQDWGLVNGKIGIYGRANFSSTHDCTPLGAEREVIRGATCDFLEVRMRLSHFRTVT